MHSEHDQVQHPPPRAGRAHVALLAALLLVALCAGVGLLWGPRGFGSLVSIGLLQVVTGEASPARATPLPTPTRLPTSTADLLANEISQGTALRGRLISVDVEPQADGTEVRIFLELPRASLADAQWDTYQVQKAVWTGQAFQIPANWLVHVILYINSTPDSAGTPIAVANLSAAHAKRFPWAQLTPGQAWGQYDGVLYNPNGL